MAQRVEDGVEQTRGTGRRRLEVGNLVQATTLIPLASRLQSAEISCRRLEGMTMRVPLTSTTQMYIT